MQDGKLTLKQQWVEGDKEAEFDGEFDTPTSIKGIYKGVDDKTKTYLFELKKVWSLQIIQRCGCVCLFHIYIRTTTYYYISLL